MDWSLETSRCAIWGRKTAVELSDLGALPGNRLEGLKDDRKRRYSIHINDQLPLAAKTQAKICDISISKTAQAISEAKITAKP